MKHVLVTGGTGFIGAALVRKLLGQGLQVRVFDNDSRGHSRNLSDVADKIELIHGDVQTYCDVEKAIRDVDAVIHLAFINGTSNFYNRPKRVLEVGVKGALNVIDAMLASGKVTTFVYASSSEVYQEASVIPTPEEIPAIIPDVKNPRYSYAGGKLLGELLTFHYVPAGSVRRLVFRPHNVYGPAMGWEHVIPELIEKLYRLTNGFKSNQAELTIQGDGSETRAFCFIDDAIEGIWSCVDRGSDGEIYHVGKDEEISIAQLIEELGQLLRINITLKCGALMPGSAHRRCPDISKLRQLGYRPKISLREGLRETIEWYKHQLEGGYVKSPASF